MFAFSNLFKCLFLQSDDMKAKLCSLILLILCIMPVVLADSPPAIPVRFDGSVTVNGAEVEDGTVVSVELNDVELVSTQTIDSQYSVHIPSDVSGDEYIFYISDVEAGRHRVLDSGSYAEFNLEVDDGEEDTNPPPTTTTSSASSSSSAAPAVSINELTDTYQPFQINVGRGKSFELDDQKHTIMLDGISNDVARITISANQITISAGEVKELNLDPESDYLLNIRADTLDRSTANIALKYVLKSTSTTTSEGSAEPETISEGQDIVDSEEETEASSSSNLLTGAFLRLRDMSTLQYIYSIIAVFIIILAVLFSVSWRARQLLKIALRKVLRGSNENTKN